MSAFNAPRERFTDGALNTASGPKIIGLAYDRIDRDLEGAIAAMERRDIPRTHELLVHAQDVVYELMFMVDHSSWEHAGDLSSIYRFVIDMLVRANVSKRPAEAVEARRMLAELGDAFRQAAVLAAAHPLPAPAPTDDAAGAPQPAFASAAMGRPAVDADRPRLSVRA
jgi:flagellar protein FliS